MPCRASGCQVSPAIRAATCCWQPPTRLRAASRLAGGLRLRDPTSTLRAAPAFLPAAAHSGGQPAACVCLQGPVWPVAAAGEQSGRSVSRAGCCRGGCAACAVAARMPSTHPGKQASRCTPAPQVSAGGLVSALMGVGNFKTKWIGWPGTHFLPGVWAAWRAARELGGRGASGDGEGGRGGRAAGRRWRTARRVDAHLVPQPTFLCLVVPLSGVYIEAGPERDELTAALHSEGYSPVYLVRKTHTHTHTHTHSNSWLRGVRGGWLRFAALEATQAKVSNDEPHQ